MEPFRDMFDGLRQTGEALIAATEALAIANASLKTAAEAVTRTAEAALHAHEEHEDLRVTVQRLETLVLGLLRLKRNGQ